MIFGYPDRARGAQLKEYRCPDHFPICRSAGAPRLMIIAAAPSLGAARGLPSGPPAAAAPDAGLATQAQLGAEGLPGRQGAPGRSCSTPDRRAALQPQRQRAAAARLQHQDRHGGGGAAHPGPGLPVPDRGDQARQGGRRGAARAGCTSRATAIPPCGRPTWRRLAEQVRAAGIRTVTGKLIVDASYFDSVSATTRPGRPATPTTTTRRRSPR